MHRSTLLAVSLFLFAGHASGARAQSLATPADSTAFQTLVPRLTNLASLSTIMNLARGTVRILAVVSPSSPGATEGMDTIVSILQDIPSKRFRVYVVLSHAGTTDSQVRALDLASRYRDRRIVYMWDENAAVAAAMAPLVGDDGEPANDVYFLYDTDATFTLAPATPVLWMQMNPRIEGTKLQAEPLGERANELVRAVEKKAATAALQQE